MTFKMKERTGDASNQIKPNGKFVKINSEFKRNILLFYKLQMQGSRSYKHGWNSL